MTSYLPKCESHLQGLISAASDSGSAFWPSVVDVRTGRYPEGDHVPRRVYRLIGAPRGSTLYWDQPMIVAAYGISEETGQARYAEAADRYIDKFLSRCVADTGMFRWGNHAYYDVFRNEVVEFHGGHHELRPITPAWEVFWQRDPEKVANYIRTMADRHVYAAAAGGFNRHDDGQKGHAFIEAGGILSESLAWLYSKTGDRGTLETALRIAGYSYGHRDPTTAIVPNEPDMGRWDSKVCTTEIGLWAQCLLRANLYTDCDDFVAMARDSVAAYMENAFDKESGKFFGQVGVRDGMPVIPEQPGYWPRKYSDPWNTDQWPTHDYPMSVAEACLSLYGIAGDQAFLQGARRWAVAAVETRPGRGGTLAYAENYGRCIHFLTRAGLLLEEDRHLADARTLADEAVDCLWEDGMFQGYPGEHLYESVDGVGFLLLALMFLDSRGAINTHGIGF